ncbi:MAG: TetR/AcrR family transcriptional regulator [Candidatus Acidiferrales bacterium]
MKRSSSSAVASPVSSHSSHDRILEAAKSLFARQGYENTSTVAIARLAGTSESQLMKHFGSKEGLLEAIFSAGWQKMIPRLQASIRGISSPAEKFHAFTRETLGMMERDPDLRRLLLLEGRRIRKEGQHILMTQGFYDFVAALDAVIGEMHAAGQLRADIHPEAVRSALMGATEGLLRDQLLKREVGFPAHYSSKEVHEIIALLASAFTAPGR